MLSMFSSRSAIFAESGCQNIVFENKSLSQMDNQTHYNKMQIR